jgi:DNA-binding MarR family transcriptional regulator
LPAATKPRSAQQSRQNDRPLNLDGLSGALGFQLRMLDQVISKNFTSHFQALQITPTLYAILVLVNANPLCRQSDLSAALKMHQPNLVERVGILIERGLLSAQPDPNDRRANTLQLTFAGKHFMEKLQQAHEAHLSDMRALLGEPAYLTLVETLGRASPD